MKSWRNGLKLRPTGISTKHSTAHLPEPPGTAGASGAELEAAELEGAAVPQQTQPAASAARVEAKSDRSTALLSLRHSTGYRHRSGRKVIRMTEGGEIKITCNKRLHGVGVLVV